MRTGSEEVPLVASSVEKQGIKLGMLSSSAASPVGVVEGMLDAMQYGPMHRNRSSQARTLKTDLRVLYCVLRTSCFVLLVKTVLVVAELLQKGRDVTTRRRQHGH